MTQLKKYTFACMLTAMIMALELVAATTGEALVALTMLSALPLYFLGRERTAYAALSYASVALLLVCINPHQCLFFVATNGLLGLALGISDRKLQSTVAALFLSCLVLFCGTLAVSAAIGWLVHWWIPAVLLPFCLGYTALYRFAARKAYAKWLRITERCH